MELGRSPHLFLCPTSKCSASLPVSEKRCGTVNASPSGHHLSSSLVVEYENEDDEENGHCYYKCLRCCTRMVACAFCNSPVYIPSIAFAPTSSTSASPTLHSSFSSVSEDEKEYRDGKGDANGDFSVKKRPPCCRVCGFPALPNSPPLLSSISTTQTPPFPSLCHRPFPRSVGKMLYHLLEPCSPNVYERSLKCSREKLSQDHLGGEIVGHATHSSSLVVADSGVAEPVHEMILKEQSTRQRNRKKRKRRGKGKVLAKTTPNKDDGNEPRSGKEGEQTTYSVENEQTERTKKRMRGCRGGKSKKKKQKKDMEKEKGKAFIEEESCSSILLEESNSSKRASPDSNMAMGFLERNLGVVRAVHGGKLTTNCEDSEMRLHLGERTEPCMGASDVYSSKNDIVIEEETKVGKLQEQKKRSCDQDGDKRDMEKEEHDKGEKCGDICDESERKSGGGLSLQLGDEGKRASKKQQRRRCFRAVMESSLLSFFFNRISSPLSLPSLLSSLEHDIHFYSKERLHIRLDQVKKSRGLDDDDAGEEVERETFLLREIENYVQKVKARIQRLSSIFEIKSTYTRLQRALRTPFLTRDLWSDQRMIAIRMEEQAWMQFNTQAKEGVSLLSPLSTLLVNVVYHIRLMSKMSNGDQTAPSQQPQPSSEILSPNTPPSPQSSMPSSISPSHPSISFSSSFSCDGLTNCSGISASSNSFMTTSQREEMKGENLTFSTAMEREDDEEKRRRMFWEKCVWGMVALYWEIAVRVLILPTDRL